MYKTIVGQASAEFIEKKSKFISYVSNISCEDDAINFIKKIKQENWNATHNVYAYILKKNQIQRYSDDGEPRGTAGVPVLNILLKCEIYNVVVVVTRYFGGTLLGAGGLIRAYSNGCKLALQNATTTYVYKCQKISIDFDYNSYLKIKNLLSNYHHKILKTNYEKNISLDVVIRQASFENLLSELLEITDGKITYKQLENLEMSLT